MRKIKSFLYKKRKLIIKSVSVLLVISIAIGIFNAYDNFRLDVEYFPVSSQKLSDSFDGFKIAHISDYHSRKSETINNLIFDALDKEKPDIIVLTGDLVDSRSRDTATALEFAERLTKVTDVYFVSGNHEGNLLVYDQWSYIAYMEQLRAAGVRVLTNETVEIEADDGSILYIHGIDDPYLGKDKVDIEHATHSMCSSLTMGEGFNILLAHHPEQLDVYSEYGFDLVFSGHAHGGQITFFGLGLFAPDQSGIPEYTSGLYEMGSTKMILSRGIGYSVAPIRVFCTPHIIFTELHT